MSSLESILQPLLGVPYNSYVKCVGDHGPFWAFNGPLPKREEIEKDGMNCAGLLNLVCRGFHVPVPRLVKADFYAGGTHAWYVYLQQKDVLRPYSPWAVYPKGTLLLRRFTLEKEDEGHLAIYMGPNTIVHSWPTTGSCFDTIQPDFYEFVCLPENWIL